MNREQPHQLLGSPVKGQALMNPDLHQMVKKKSTNPSEVATSKSNLKTICWFVCHPTI
jgi:hypothetical protein